MYTVIYLFYLFVITAVLLSRNYDVCLGQDRDRMLAQMLCDELQSYGISLALWVMEISLYGFRCYTCWELRSCFGNASKGQSIMKAGVSHGNQTTAEDERGFLCVFFFFCNMVTYNVRVNRG